MSGLRRTLAQRWRTLPRARRWLFWLGVLVVLVFLGPIVGGIFGLANALGTAGGLVLMAWALWQPEGIRLLQRLWRRLWGRVLLLASGAGVLAILGWLAVLSVGVMGDMGASPDVPCPTVIVLGCQVRGTQPSLLLQYRIQAAADYLRQNPETVAILSGSTGPGEEISEAECMRRGLVALGIDPARLRLEDQSHITLENLRFSMALMEREGLSGPVALISNDFHIHRALIMAEELHLDARGLAARSNWYSKPTYVLREALALVKYRLMGGA